MKEDRIWLILAQEGKCKHAEAIRKLGFINWRKKSNSHFVKGDTVFLFMSDSRSVRYEMQVDAEDCKREDQEFWIETPPKGLTYKFKFLKEYKENLLSEAELEKHGLKPNGLQNAICNNKPLLDYIQSMF
jgi:hypothetical protein